MTPSYLPKRKELQINGQRTVVRSKSIPSAKKGFSLPFLHVVGYKGTAASACPAVPFSWGQLMEGICREINKGQFFRLDNWTVEQKRWTGIGYLSGL